VPGKTKLNPGPRGIDRELIVEALANPELTTRDEQAAALNITREQLWRRRCEDPSIDRDALELAKDRSAETMAAGLRRIRRIIVEGSNDMAAVQAVKFLAQYRGEFVEKREHSGDVTWRWADEGDAD
jgi:hypothetical protein